MSKRNYVPKSALQDKGLIGPFVQEKFNNGMIKDSSPLEIPNNAVVEIENAVPSDETARGRKGTRRYGSAVLPDWTYNDSQLNANLYHPILNRFFVLTDSGLYHTSANMDVAVGWEQIPVVGNESFHNSYSHFELEGEDLWLFNANGLFRIITKDKDVDEYIAIKANMQELDEDSRVTESKISADNISKYYYIVTHTILENSFYGQTRSDSGVRVLYESAPVFPSTDTPDYSEVDSIVPVGAYNAYLAVDTPAVVDMDTWRAYENNEVFRITIRETTIGSTVVNHGDTSLYPDLSNVNSFQDIADAINDVIQESVGYFRLGFYTTSDGDPIFYIYSTDERFFVDIRNDNISSNLGLYGFTATPGGTEVTLVTNSNDKPFTHYSIYRTTDISLILKYENGEDVDLSDGRITNDVNGFTWVTDIPRGKIVPYTITADSFILNYPYVAGTWISSDRLSNNDTLSTIIPVDGAISNKVLYFAYNDSGEKIYLLHPSAGQMDGTYGNVGCDHVAQATQVNGIVTSTSAFVSACAVGDYITWEDGTFSLVESIDSSTQITTADKSSRSTQYAGAFNMTSNKTRVYHDLTPDNVLKSKIGYESLLTRLMKPVPNCNVGTFVSGYFIGTNKGGNVISYSQVANSYHAGLHNPLIQKSYFINEGIHAITEINGIAIIRCKNKTYIMNPQQSQNAADPRFPDTVFILNDPQLVDGSIGTSNEVSVAKMDVGREVVLTSEPALRIFDGQQYSENLAEGRIQKSDMQKFTGPVTVDYDPIHGITLWGEY